MEMCGTRRGAWLVKKFLVGHWGEQMSTTEDSAFLAPGSSLAQNLNQVLERNP